MPEFSVVDVGEVTLAYRVSGRADAHPIVLLHGLTSDGSSWDEVAPALAERWRVYVPDLRGHGSSDWPGRYSFELMREDVLGFIDRLSLHQPTLIGHSMGGVAAYLLAQDHPDRVRALVLEETPAPVPHQRPVPERPDGPLSFDWPVRPAIVAQVNQPDPRWWDRISEVRTPTLVVAGGPEGPFPQDTLAAMANRFPYGQLTTISVGHGVHKVRPTEFVTTVTTFLDAVYA